MDYPAVIMGLGVFTTLLSVVVGLTLVAVGIVLSLIPRFRG